MFRAMREIDRFEFWDVMPRWRNDDLKKSVLKFWEFCFGLKALLNQRNKERVEEWNMVLQYLDSFLASDHDWMVAKQFFLGSPPINVEKQWVLIERNLRWDSQLQLSSTEFSAVDFILRQSTFDPTAEDIFKLWEIAGKIVSEGVDQFETFRAYFEVRCQNAVLYEQLQEQWELADQLPDLIFSEGHGEREWIWR